mgnify:CR=1 FL=1
MKSLAFIVTLLASFEFQRKHTLTMKMVLLTRWSRKKKPMSRMR